MDAPFRFFGEFVREPLAVGSVWPSSRSLSRVVADSCDIPDDALLVELGAGTGALTALLRQRVQQRHQFLAVEISPGNAAILRHRFPACQVQLGSAEHLPRHLGGRRANCIVSGLAWGTMLPGMQDAVLRAILESLAPDGQFVAFAYAHAAWLPTSRRFHERLAMHFRRIETTPIVWKNLPPAYVIRCWRDERALLEAQVQRPA